MIEIATTIRETFSDSPSPRSGPWGLVPVLHSLFFRVSFKGYGGYGASEGR